VNREPLLDRNGVAAMLFNVADIAVILTRIVFLIEDYLDGEEEVQEDDV
jgi:lipoprotein signal peptidase